MRKYLNSIVVLGALFCSLSMIHDDADVWGFYGHRLINRTAVFTLPVELIPLFKANIDYVTEQSVAPDKRRHASPLEAVRHYIDIDHWGANSFKEVPHELSEAMVLYGSMFVLNDNGDTLQSWHREEMWAAISDSLYPFLIHEVEIKKFELMEEHQMALPNEWLNQPLMEGGQLYFSEEFSTFGILPYHLMDYYKRLTTAFKFKEWNDVIRLSAEIGHYISDGHVPLHTTENYNGQMSNQKGIHAFWESRLPELFAEGEYDLFTGRAKYVEDKEAFFWQIIKDSHVLVADVLGKEKELSESFARDQQYCFELRGTQNVRQACEEYARAYSEAMEGMVEDRMRDAIAAVGSIWYTAWVDAGRPIVDVNELNLELEGIEVDPIGKGSHEELKN